MERFSRQPSNPQAPQSAPKAPATPSTPSTSATRTMDEPNMASKVLVLVLIVAAISVVLAFGANAWSGLRTNNLVKEDQYQAVFLDNGQVYFGRLSSVNNDYVKLNDIFYLQVEQQIQPNQTNPGETPTAQNPQISLAKLGNELHGPEDEMFILRDKITFWENLKDDGQVVTAINEFYANGGQTNNQNQTQPTQTQPTQTQPDNDQTGTDQGTGTDQ